MSEEDWKFCTRIVWGSHRNEWGEFESGFSFLDPIAVRRQEDLCLVVDPWPSVENKPVVLTLYRQGR